MNASSLINLFPGLLFAVPAAWFFTWSEHKATARMQRRIGLPLLQPLYDFVKLMGKRTSSRYGIKGDLLRLYPVVSVLSLLGAVASLPVSYECSDTAFG
jgi:NADH-quinone oxidoreductase subunit H